MTLLALGVVGLVAVLIARGEPLLVDDPVDARALRWPPGDPVQPEDLRALRFTVALRGYRMDEVDRVLDDLQAALADRDRLIEELRAKPSPLPAHPAEAGQDSSASPMPG
jgi:DivIVA domain-containing protein